MNFGHQERHRTHHVGWLRAAVLGANDGIVSTASLVVGVAASGANSREILVAGVAGLVAGAMSMATGEYVSVSSQSDTEHADIEREKRELAADIEHEKRELAAIYINRGLDPALAEQVAMQLMEKNALEAHLRDELGLTETMGAKPMQAAFISAAMFSLGALLPIAIIPFSPENHLIAIVCTASLAFLILLGTLAARMGGASMIKGAARVTFWGMLAMALTAGAGMLFGGHS